MPGVTELSASYKELHGLLLSSREQDFVPADVVLSHRKVSQDLISARSSARSLADESSCLAEASGCSATADSAGSAELLQTMSQQFVEVECLLRVKLGDADSLRGARKQVAAALAFDESLSALAKQHSKLKGAIFQQLLADARQAGITNSGGVDLSAREGEDEAWVALGLSQTEWRVLQAQADAVRKLVRIKLADDNDLAAAQCALASCRDFFTTLESVAASRKIAEFELLKTL